MSKNFAQEMPPPGGYKALDWQRPLQKKRMSGYRQFGIFCAFTAGAWVYYLYRREQRNLTDLEMRDARLAVKPLLYAEGNRQLLKQLRANRDEEEELMKDVPGWKTGTLWGEPVYNNIRGRFIVPASEEYYAHCSPRAKYLAEMERLQH